MAADPTPEIEPKRIANLIVYGISESGMGFPKRFLVDRQTDTVVKHSVELRNEIEDALIAARAKAFEEADRICEFAEEVARNVANTFDHGTPECGRASVQAHASFMLAEKIRARAKEAPRVQ